MMDRKHPLGLLVVVLFSIVFRFYSLDTTPPWDFDEGYNMRYSFDLINGEILWFSIKYTFMPHPPLFMLAYALVIKYLGVSVYTIRLLTAFYGVLTTIAIYFVGKEMFNRKVGFLASAVYAFMPEIIFWNRLGYANNQLILLSVLTMYFIYKYSKTLQEKHLYAGCLFAGLSVITEYTALLNVFAITVFMLFYHREKALKFFTLSLILMFLVFIFMLYYSPEFFIFDVKYQFNRFFSPIKIVVGLISITVLFLLRKRISNFYRPIARSLSQDTLVYVFLASLTVFRVSEYDFWHATSFLLGMCLFGMCLIPSFLIEQKKERRFLVFLLLINLFYLLVLDRADHMTMVIYPFISLLLAAMLYNIYDKSIRELPWIFNRFKIRPSKKALLTACFYPIAVSLLLSTYIFLLGNVSTQDIGEVVSVADYINEHTTEDDLVLTYSWMFPLIDDAKVSLLTHSLAYEGIGVVYYSSDFPKHRFAFNTSYKRAKYLVLTNGTLEWFMNLTENDVPLERMQTWNKTEVGSFLIYANPEYSGN